MYIVTLHYTTCLGYIKSAHCNCPTTLCEIFAVHWIEINNIFFSLTILVSVLKAEHLLKHALPYRDRSFYGPDR